MLLSLLPSIVVLGLAATAAIALALTRTSQTEHTAQRREAANALALALILQGIHFAEEALTGFPERLAQLLDLPAMPMSFFVVFNVTWLGIWVVSIPGIRSAHTGTFFAAWFLAIAGIINGVAHPLLAVASGGYFPGLVSSPFIAVAAIWLWQRLSRATLSRS